MIDTFFEKLPKPSSESGFMLIEVMISALLVGLIVVATFNGFDATNRVTADERSRAQADVLAQQDEDRMRGLQVSSLTGLNETHTATYNGTLYTVTSKAQFVSDASGESSCTGSSQKADYIQTSSEVSWTTLKSRPKIVETGLITPPVGGDLLVKVLDNKGTGVSGMTVKATGPSTSPSVTEATTTASGCVIFGALQEGTYEVDTFQTGYVNKNGESEPPTAERSVTVTSGATANKSFEFAKAGELAVSFSGGSTTGDTFVAFNTGMSAFKSFGAIETEKYKSTVTSTKTIFPFESSYTVYAGTCEADKPSASIIEANESHFEKVVAAGESASITTILPPINLKVMSGTASGSSTEGSAVSNASGTLEDTGCKTTRKFKTTSSGALPNPGMPFGTYSLCVTASVSGKSRKSTISVTNNTVSGTALQTIYLGAGKLESGCP